ncbi:putative GMP-PDE; delta subunit family protein [Paratrimastix pyriformis]|uniref:GMP-PDE n=1 Tax=Paratrimastix pyriformis TaxID=342808 RepID=A0ABQ8UT55_9EUKA|nr:putative GMP-PDE; delta subunit family protein [Paratrimastix pyriformis]
MRSPTSPSPKSSPASSAPASPFASCIAGVRPGIISRPSGSVTSAAASSRAAPAPATSAPLPPGEDAFKIINIRIRDLETKAPFWTCRDWSNIKRTTEMHLPRKLLQCSSVAREFTFSSHNVLENLRLQQTVYLHDQPIEEWNFEFGFVIPGSTNTWESVVLAAAPEEMIPAEIISGNMVIDTAFYDGSALLARKRLTVFYE